MRGSSTRLCRLRRRRSKLRDARTRRRGHTGSQQRDHPDTSLTTLLEILAARHPGEADAIKTGLLFTDSSLTAFSKIQKDLVATLNDAGGQLDLKGDDNIKRFLSLTDAFGRVSRDVYDLKERMPQLQDDMDEILNVLAREPVVFSSFEISDDGRPYVRLSLNCFARFLERRYEVTNRLNRHIEAEFAKLGIWRMDRPAGGKKGSV